MRDVQDYITPLPLACGPWCDSDRDCVARLNETSKVLQIRLFANLHERMVVSIVR